MSTRSTCLVLGYRSHVRHRAAILQLLAFAPLVIAGCKVGGPSPADQYRIEARDLRNELEATKAENAELKTKLAQLATARSVPMSAEAIAALPQLAKISIGSYSGPTNDAPVDGKRLVRIYVQPADSRGRFVQITGELAASVTIAGQDQPIGTARLTPSQLREAYRSGFMGVYYMIDVPVDAALLPHGAALQAAINFTDAQSGRELKVEGPIGSATDPRRE